MSAPRGFPPAPHDVGQEDGHQGRGRIGDELLGDADRTVALAAGLEQHGQRRLAVGPPRQSAGVLGRDRLRLAARLGAELRVAARAGGDREHAASHHADAVHPAPFVDDAPARRGRGPHVVRPERDEALGHLGGATRVRLPQRAVGARVGGLEPSKRDPCPGHPRCPGEEQREVAERPPGDLDLAQRLGLVCRDLQHLAEERRVGAQPQPRPADQAQRREPLAGSQPDRRAERVVDRPGPSEQFLAVVIDQDAHDVEHLLQVARPTLPRGGLHGALGQGGRVPPRAEDLLHTGTDQQDPRVVVVRRGQGEADLVQRVGVAADQ